MKNITISNQIFHNENKAREYLESIRWPDGPICPHCNGSDKVYELKGKSTRPGLWKCGHCRKQFTVTVGTIFEGSHIPLAKWLMAIYLVCSSKKSISANQLHQMLGITYKSAWFMAHRVRLAMTQYPLSDKLQGVVEANETYIGERARGKKGGRGAKNKTKFFALIQRNVRALSFRVDDVKSKTLKTLIRENVADTTHFMTDEFPFYYGLEKYVASHSVVNHGTKEYVHGIIHTNFSEFYFSLLKRGILGTFRHVSETHIGRYLNEFNFRWNNKTKDNHLRLIKTIEEPSGKRLFYRDSLN